ncbi:hypothetical protein V6R21_17045 [Limibacter armeniacum]|uniref:tetratricopeptide repeat protein n=1 Tax=Limibacter armeniacum TaxID=466084 RepID=UPI002FE5362F
MKETIRLILIIGFVALQGCVSSSKMIKKANELERAGSACQAIDQYLYKLADKPSAERDRALYKIGYVCVESYLEQSREYSNAGASIESLEQAYAIAERAKSRLENINRQFGVSLKWKAVDQKHIDDLYARITEDYYQRAMSYYKQGAYQQAYEAFEDVIAREPSYKEAVKYKNTSYDNVTAKHYEQAMYYFDAKKYEDAEEAFAVVTGRDPSYRDAQELYVFSYDQVTQNRYDAAMGYFDAQSYRKAYPLFSWVKSRERNEKYPRLDSLMQQCIDRGSVGVYISSAYPALTNRVYSDLVSDIDNPFIRFENAEAKADYSVIVSLDYHVDGARPIIKKREAYKIDHWVEKHRVMQSDSTYKTVEKTYYKAVRPVTYMHFYGTKEVRCKVSYAVRGTNIYQEFEGVSEESLDCYTYTGDLSLNSLSDRKINKTSDKIRPSSSWKRMFEGRPSFSKTDDMKEDALNIIYKRVVDDLYQDIVTLIEVE